MTHAAVSDQLAGPAQPSCRGGVQITVQRNKVREGRGQENPLFGEKVNYDYEDYTAELLQNQANDMSVRGGRQVTNERLGKCQLPPGAWSQWSVVTHNV